MADLIERATEAAKVAGMSNGAMILELRDALTDAHATIARLTRERDEDIESVVDTYNDVLKDMELKVYNATVRAEAAEAQLAAMREVVDAAKAMRWSSPVASHRARDAFDAALARLDQTKGESHDAA